jgi:hypothetical protein
MFLGLFGLKSALSCREGFAKLSGQLTTTFFAALGREDFGEDTSKSLTTTILHRVGPGSSTPLDT